MLSMKLLQDNALFQFKTVISSTIHSTVIYLQIKLFESVKSVVYFLKVHIAKSAHT